MCSLDHPNQAAGCPRAASGQEGAGCPTPRLALGASCSSAVTDWIAGGRGEWGRVREPRDLPESQSCLTFCNPMDCSTPGFPVPHHLLEFAQHQFIASVMPSSHLILQHPLLLLPLIFPRIRYFSNESVRIRQPKYWGFSTSPSSEYSGLISLKIDWFDPLLVQGTFRSPLQHHSLKAVILWLSAFFLVQLSQLHVTTGKTIALTIRTFVSRLMCLLFNTLSRFVITFLPRLAIVS